MFSVAPINFGAISTAETLRTPHLEQTQIEALIIKSVDEVLIEWLQHNTPLGSESRPARNLFASVDHFLANGCIEGNRTYWKFIKEFLSASHRRYFQQECRVRSDRDLSIVWLKDSLNKQALPYYLQSFLLNWAVIRKYYTTNAMMRKRSVVQRITRKLLEVSEVEFCFIIQFKAQDNVPIAVINSPQSSSTTENLATSSRGFAHRQKVIKEFEELEDAAFSAISDVEIAPDMVEIPPNSQAVPFLSTAEDFDYIFAEILKEGKSQLPTTVSLTEGSDSRQVRPASLERPPSQPGAFGAVKTNDFNLDRPQNKTEAAVNPFDVALKSSLSHAKLISLCEHDTPAKKHSLSPSLGTDFAPFGEVCLDVGEVIGLSINVFKTETEKFLRFFQVYESFGTGLPKQRFLVLSNRSIYLLSFGSNSSKLKTYITHSYLPLKNIESISVSPDYEVLYINAEKNYSLGKADDGFQVIEICTACTQLGETIVHAISFAHSEIVSLENNELKIFTESTAHHSRLNKFMAKELPEVGVNLKCYTLAQWRQTRAECPGGFVRGRSGYLYHKTLRSSSWLLNAGEFQQSYFYILGRKFYQFTDSTCKVGERIISLPESVLNVKKTGDDSQNLFEMEFQNGEKMRFQCQNRSDMESWITLLTSAVFSTDWENEAVACIVAISDEHVLVAQDGENCVVDGFMRTLSVIRIRDIKEAAGVLACKRFACVLESDNKLDWLFLRSPDEVDRVLAILQQLEVLRICRHEDGSSRLVALLNALPQSGDLFYFENVHSDDAFEACTDY